MSKLLKLYDWLTLPEALDYLVDGGLDLTLEELLRAYTEFDYELRLDFKNPTIYFLPDASYESYTKLQVSLSPSDRFIVSGVLTLSAKLYQQGYGGEHPVWITHETLASDGIPVYLLEEKGEGFRSEEVLKVITWQTLLYEIPQLLLFERSRLDSISELAAEVSSKQVSRTSAGKVSSDLTAREKNTLFVLLAALCREAKVDYKQKGAAAVIEKMTQNLGVPITEETILKYLRQIDEVVQDRLQ